MSGGHRCFAESHGNHQHPDRRGEPELSGLIARRSRAGRLPVVGAVPTLAAALALIEQAVPDVLVVDLGLPDGNGTELIRRAARRRADCDAWW